MNTENTTGTHRQGHIPLCPMFSCWNGKGLVYVCSTFSVGRGCRQKWTSSSLYQLIATVPYLGIKAKLFQCDFYLYYLGERGEKIFDFPLDSVFEIFVISVRKYQCNKLSSRLRQCDSKGCRNPRLNGQVCAVPLIQRISFFWSTEQDVALHHQMLGQAVSKIMQVIVFPRVCEYNCIILPQC